MAKRDDLVWYDVDMTAHADSKPVAAHRKASEVFKAAGRDLEAFLTEKLRSAGHVPAGQEPLFSFRFGKVSFALRPISAAKPGKVTL